jgi:hypothetical protein
MPQEMDAMIVPAGPKGSLPPGQETRGKVEIRKPQSGIKGSGES